MPERPEDNITQETLDAAAARDAEILGKPPRIAPMAPDEYSDEIRATLIDIMKTAGLPPDAPVPDYTATVFRYPEMFGLHSDLSLKLMAKGEITPRDRELAILRTGWLSQAPFEWSAHIEIAHKLGVVTQEEVDWLIIGSIAPGWNDHDRAVIRAVEELISNAMITDATWAELAKTMNERQLMEFPIMVGQYVGIAYLQNSLRIRLLPGHTGLASR